MAGRVRALTGSSVLPNCFLQPRHGANTARNEEERHPLETSRVFRVSSMGIRANACPLSLS